MALVEFLMAVLAGWLLVHLAGPARGMRPRWAAVVLEAALGAGAGVGVTSWLYFLLLVSGAASAAAVLAASGGLLLLLAILVWRMRSRGAQPDTTGVDNRPAFRWTWILAVVLATSMSAVALVEYRLTVSNPHGGWDAWAIWNLRAKFLAGPGDSWRTALSPDLTRTHPDYPLLVSGFIASNWRAAGDQTSPGVPIATAYLFAISVAALVVASLALMKGTSLGLLAGTVLVANQLFLEHLNWQYADIPLSLYILAALSAALLSELNPKRGGWAAALAGLFASLAAWTKDEGLLFAAVLLVCYPAAQWWLGGWKLLVRRLPWFVGGALPGLALVAVFKLALAPAANPMLAQGAARAGGRLLVGTRWWNLLQALGLQVSRMGDGLLHPLLILLVLVAALGFSVSKQLRKPLVFGVVVFAGLFAGYCAAVLANPTLLQSRAWTPFDRMFSQLWPAFVFLAFLPLRAMEELTPPAPPPKPPAEPRKRKKRS